MKIILLIDMDSFFASVEQQSNPALRGKPVAVTGSGKRTVVTTASYEAREFGVKTGMNMFEARKLCPHLIFIVGNNDKYAHTCGQLADIYAEFTPMVEVYSIDEAFLDITGSQDLFGSPLEIGERIRKEIKDKFGLNATIGIGPNKLIAKLASNISKPDGLLWIKPGEVSHVLENLPVDELWGIGSKLKEKLNSLGIYTCGELGRTSASFLRSHFGINGEHLKQMGMGTNNSPVTGNIETARSIGHSMTLPRDIWREKDIEAYILKLSEMVGRRARKYKLMGNVINVVIRYISFHTFSRQSKIKRHTNDTHDIHFTAMKIIRDLQLIEPVRLLGVGLSGLVESEKPEQVLLLHEYSRKQDLLRAMDSINDRYGEFTLSWASSTSRLSRPDVISPAWRPTGIHRTNI